MTANNETAPLMTQSVRRALLYLVAAFGLAGLTACRDQAAAPKQDRETNNYYGRLESIDLAYSDTVLRNLKRDRLSGQRPVALNAEKTPPSARKSPADQALSSGPRGIARPGRARTELVALKAAPFPYDGKIGRTDEPFFNVAENGRRGHRTPFNRVYWEDETYSDPRVLLHIPRDFDSRKPGLIVLFFHGHGATLDRDVIKRQQVPKQISASGVNAVLVAPQLAVDARDSSPGKFWEPGAAKRFLGEAAAKLASLYGDPRSKEAFSRMPVVIVAYSGGFMPAAWAISRGGFGRRLQGVVLLDGLYGHTEVFRNWITGQNSGFFVSAYANSTRTRNENFEKLLSELNVPVRARLGPALDQDSVVFISTDAETEHRDFVTKAWTDAPIKDLLQRIQLNGRTFLSGQAYRRIPTLAQAK